MTLADRRLHMVGIGGAGMSALAIVAYAWGADVSGCDRDASDYAHRLERFGIDVRAGHDRSHLEPGMEVVVSSAVPDELDELAAAAELGLRVLHRGELLAELVAQRRSICVGGAHGKTTTTAMIAYAAERLGLEPTWLVGGDVPQLGGNAGPGGGDLLVAEADESDGSAALLRPRVAVVTNVDLDHHARYASLAEVERLFADWVAQVPAEGAVVLGDGVSFPAAAPVWRFGFDPGADWHITGFRGHPDGSRFWLSVPDEPPVDVELKVPGAHNARNAAGALAALAAAGANAPEAAAALAEFTGVGRRFELRGTVAGATVVDDYAHNPAKVAAVDRRRSHIRARAGGGVLPAAPVLAHRRIGIRLRRRPGRRRRGGGDRDLRRPRAPGRRGHCQAGRGRGVRAAAGHAAGVHAGARRRGRIPARTDARRRPGADRGRGRRAPGRRRAAAMSGEPACVQADYPVSRLTTVGTGGPARFFARPGDAGELAHVLRWAAEQGLEIAVVGLGSNLLVADEGYDGLVLRLVGDLARIDRDGDRIVCGGGATLAAIVKRATEWGLSGIEFGCAIPGTAGGAVRMNAGAYGGELRDVLEGAVVVGAAGERRGGPDELEMTYRHSNVEAGEVVAGAVLRLRPDDPGRDPRRPSPTCSAAAARRSRRRCARSGRCGRTRTATWRPARCSRRAGSRGSRSAAPASRRCTRTSSRTWAAPGRRT